MSESEFRYIQVKSADVRSTPSFLGKIIFKVAYTRQVSVARTNGSWVNIFYDGNTGWVHESALSTRAIYLNADAAKAHAQVSDDEITLAGKGFSKEIEKQYRKKHGDAGFADVDKLEKITMRATVLANFLKTGKLTPPGEKI